MINILNIFSKIENCKYCIVKLSDTFPSYRKGDDIDIFCYSVDDIVSSLLIIGNNYINSGYNIKIKSIIKKEHVHVDFIIYNEIDIRFDIYGTLPEYNKIMIKPALFESIIENSIQVAYTTEYGPVIVKIPSVIDDMLIRYFEFVQWYDVRPDKIKHLSYIVDSLSESNRRQFFEKLHHYTKLPNTYYQEKNKISILCSLSNFIKKIFK